MTFTTALDEKSELSLITEYEDGWTINELSVIYRISERTIYRILGRHNVRKRHNRKFRYRKPKDKTPRKLYPCGTNAAYQRHRKNKEYPCGPCLAAHSLDVQENKRKKNS